jgi:hypothetical protein
MSAKNKGGREVRKPKQPKKPKLTNGKPDFLPAAERTRKPRHAK